MIKIRVFGDQALKSAATVSTWYRRQWIREVDVDGREIGALGGAMATLAVATGEVIGASIRHKRVLRTIGEWSRALDTQRQARIKSERENLRLLQEVEFLRQALFEVQEELMLLRGL